MMKSRRKHDRFSKSLELDFSVREEKHQGISGNFSREGCFIRTKGSFPPGAIVHIDLKLPDHSASSLTGIIRWAKAAPEASPENGIGVEIINEDDAYLGFAEALSGEDHPDADPGINQNINLTNPEQVEHPAEPPAGATVAESVIVSCGNCGVKNRLPKTRLPENPKCGKCGSLLKAVSDSENGESSAFTDGPSVSLHEKTARVGDLIGGRYRVQEIFGGEGKSSMGIVYKCFDVEHNRILALKTLQQRFLDSKKTADSFKKEALAWIYLGNHPNIVRAYWVRELDHKMFVACEFIIPDGAGRNSVTPYLQGRLSLKQVLTWAIQLCHGMDYACSKGVTPHRDIKPDNIMITMDGDVKITDFGLVGLWDRSQQSDEIRNLIRKNQEGLAFLSMHNDRIVAGSPPWMAPEQFYGVAEVQSDIYSFGIVLFQMIKNGELPFKPRRGETWRTAHKEYPVPRIPTRGEAVAHIINKCLQKRRDRRYSDFGELRKDLEEVFRKEITRETGEEPPPPPQPSELSEAELINKGMSLANLGLVEEGIKNYREGIKLNPGNAEAHYNLGNALSQKGRLPEAIREYRQALRIDRGMTAAHFNLGIALYNNGQIDEAIAEYKEALRSDPGLDSAFVNLGVALHKKGLIGEAIKAYLEAVRINPFFAGAYYKLGLALFAGNDPDGAIKAFEESIKINPVFVEAHNNLGSAYMKKGLTDEAIHSYLEAVRSNSGYADSHYNLGIAYIKKNKHREALAAFENFLAISGRDDGRVEKAKEAAAKLRKHLAGPAK